MRATEIIPGKLFLGGREDAEDWIAKVVKPLLVRCGAGIERSPLVVAYYVATRTCLTDHGKLEEGYDYVKRRRPQIQERFEWIPWGWEQGCLRGFR